MLQNCPLILAFSAGSKSLHSIPTPGKIMKGDQGRLGRKDNKFEGLKEALN